MTPIGTRLQRRLEERRQVFESWLFQWFTMKDGGEVHIDLFNGRQGHWRGIGYSGSLRRVFWDAIPRGIRNEIVDQFAWVESEATKYRPEIAAQAFDEAAGQLASFAEVIRRRAVDYDQRLRGDGINIPSPSDEGLWHGTSRKDVQAQAEALKAAHVGNAPLTMGNTSSTKDENQPGVRTRAKYQVALSFAGEQRAYVEEVANTLLADGVSVFYDRHNAVELWGQDGAEAFHRLFSQDTAYVVMFISRDYVEKAWPRHERRSAISRAMQEEEAFILPVRFDDTDVPGMPTTLQYLEATSYTPSQLAHAIIKKIGFAPLSGKASDLPPPQASSLSGEVSFDYSSHDGHFIIGDGDAIFETKWSRASDTAIHIYNDPSSIHGVAIATDAKDISDVSDAEAYDFSSRTRTPHINEVVILKNRNCRFAALKVLELRHRGSGEGRDELRFEYVINADGDPSFARSGEAPLRVGGDGLEPPTLSV